MYPLGPYDARLRSLGFKTADVNTLRERHRTNTLPHGNFTLARHFFYWQQKQNQTGTNFT
ncbi:hypothetical protein MDA_GLEAN10019462 [Myotis davidii]|uniref:Uncharacterized protein n=1 Tax=Myotis davidii TaxID=225400 RepID=L5LD84_MYODS|nr:hypothetical protein MDA_GLEAN10019462 [Myotis davidii]